MSLRSCVKPMCYIVQLGCYILLVACGPATQLLDHIVPCLEQHMLHGLGQGVGALPFCLRVLFGGC